MTMSKKDYQAIARAINNGAHAHPENWQSDISRSTIKSIINHVADVLAADNPRFDRALFIEACETGKCKGMRQ